MIEKTFNNGSFNLSYAEGSNNGLPMILLHGVASRWLSFHYLIPHLEKHFHLYALDLRGHGQSDRGQSYKMQDYVSDISSFIKNIIKEPTIIFGHSYGGMIGTIVSAYYPELIKALIIGDSLITLDSLKEFSMNHKDTTVFWRDLARLESVEPIMSELKNQLIPVPNQKDLIPAYKVLGENNPHFEFMAHTLKQLDPNVLTADIEYFEDTYSEYQTDILFPKIQCPVLLLQANSMLGGLMKDEDVQMALDFLSNAHHVKVKNAGHFLIAQDTESVIKAVIPFIESYCE